MDPAISAIVCFTDDMTAPKPTDTQLSHWTLEDFAYDLPPELIAQEPLPVRHESRLLRLDKQNGSLSHHLFSDLKDLLTPGDTIVVNNTKVIPARIIAQRASGGHIKLLLLRPLARGANFWEALVQPIKRLKEGEILRAGDHEIKVLEIILDQEGHKRLIVDLGDPKSVYAFLDKAGFAPLPPYIRREIETAPDGKRKDDIDRYQTVFAAQPGAVAAPTAGLHFSNTLLEELAEKKVDVRYITLHVGPGTFKPISSSLDSHYIEPERYSIPADTAAAINKAKEEGRRVIAVGTTSLRALESAVKNGRLEEAEDAVTDLYVKPGHAFKIIDGLITNFHLSKSSLLVLVAALAGREYIMNAYHDAIQKRYRFFSYGDAMLII